MFLWRIKAGVIPTKDLLVARIGGNDTECALCGDQKETYLHIFKECSFTRALAFASKWGCILENWIVDNISDVINGCLEKIAKFQGRSMEFSAIFLCTLFYCCWEYRNKVIPSGKANFMQVVSHFENSVEDFWEGRGDGEGEDRNAADWEEEEERWKLPMMGWLKANVDAAFKNERAALAVVVRDDRGRLMQLASKTTCCEDALEAECLAMEWGTDLVERQGWNKVIWSVDSKQVVEEIQSPRDPEG